MGLVPFFYISSEVPEELAEFLVYIPDYAVYGLDLNKLGDYSVKFVADVIVDVIRIADRVFVGSASYNGKTYPEIQLMFIDSAPQKFIIDFTTLLLISDREVSNEDIHIKLSSIRVINYRDFIREYAEKLREYYSRLPFSETITRNHSIDLKTKVTLLASNSLLVGLKIVFPTGDSTEIELPAFLWSNYLEEIGKNERFGF